MLLDECVDWRLGRELSVHEVKSARQMGWTTLKNGELLALASATSARRTPSANFAASATQLGGHVRSGANFTIRPRHSGKQDGGLHPPYAC